MDIATLSLFLPACFALNMAPGPNNLLSVSNATRYGYRRACVAGVGRLLAFAGMIALAAAGLAVVLQTSELLFYGIKIIGAGYLLYLAWQLWRANPAAEDAVAASANGLMALARQEFLVAAGNPKAILIFTAFLPQFVDPARAITPQFMLLGALFLLLEWIAISAYAYMGLHMRRWFAEPRGKRIFNRCCAGLLSAAASVLLMAKRA
ncbi:MULTISPECIES: LysE family translocator [Pseudomonas]|uniref:Putative amino acid efflux protein, LysE family n=1 Tax=Pseudomonas fluorescens (strain Pf0-1) TaxID=205922 RepID=Q3KEA3_PSEPF|nr:MULTISPECIES: LysE family translocator [Pseudomonas]ABA73903.1 putative amino acid efflux protein, LysE family [Pseudomonas fluorescens Pf0-1]MBL0795202.1 LysE family translocator [Pseudomonas sp. B7]MBX8624520.1 LysE family translocator [Pseudomonas glycinae]MBY9027273.1 LysE family translocator [Pseudomonas fluorescens]MBY9033056.1 LysE family translocator [Pseudomonas fluorescens]